MQGAGEVGRRARAVAASERGAVSYRLLLLALAAYLVWTSVNDFAPVVSRVIRWASAWFKPAAFALLVAALAWDGRGQAQRLWTDVQALVRRQALRPRPATCVGGAKCGVGLWRNCANWRLRVERELTRTPPPHVQRTAGATRSPLADEGHQSYSAPSAQPPVSESHS